MRIHSDTLTYNDLAAASQRAVVTFTEADRKGSRKRHHAYEVKLSGDSPFRQMGNRDEFAATWDQWGIFLGEIFDRDPNATVTGVYRNAEDFHWKTGDRFHSLTYTASHRRHKWSYVFSTNTTATHQCPCGAIQRYQFTRAAA